jgi:large subunit ribosomal protein L13
MTDKSNPQTHTFDASGRKLGRISTEIAEKLMGKDRVDFTRRKAPDVTVQVENAADLDISDKKRNNKTYVSHSGYPGGQKEVTADTIIKKHGYGKLIRKAVYGMLPDNKLRDTMMKNLHVSE